MSDPSTEHLYGETLAAGALAGSYMIDELAFQGGFASIYRAHHMQSGQPVALKVLHHRLVTRARMIERFEQEAEALSRLRHPHIVTIFELGELMDERPYIAMEWLEGRNLAQELHARGPLAGRDALAVMNELGDALSAAHELGVVHRDLKAANVMALPRGDWFTVKLVDFGIAKLIAPEDQGTAMTTRTLIGTPQTMAPEQIMGQSVDTRTDIYALGVLLYQLVTGRYPFAGGNLIEIEDMHLHAAPPRASDIAPVSAALDAVIARAMHKQKQDRYQTATALVADLRAAVEGRADPASLRARARRSRGIAIYLEVCSAAALDRADDDMLDRIDDAMAHARQRMSELGMTIVLDTAAELLSACAVAEGSDEPALRRAALDAARALMAELAAMLAPAEGAPAADREGLTAVVHVGELEVEPGQDQPAGGELLALDRWPRPLRARGLYATTATLAGLDEGVAAAPVSRELCRIELPIT